MKLQYNAPVILTFTIVCVVVLFFGNITLDIFMSFFTVYPTMDFGNPIDYFRLVSHAMGHSNWDHLVGNFTFILLLGPILEEKYGSKKLMIMIMLTAFVTGVLNVMFFSTALLGASGIVFMMIILSSAVNIEEGKIPLTFILVVLLFLGKEVFNSFQADRVSQFAHIVGGLFGAVFGFVFKKKGQDQNLVKNKTEVYID